MRYDYTGTQTIGYNEKNQPRVIHYFLDTKVGDTDLQIHTSGLHVIQCSLVNRRDGSYKTVKAPKYAIAMAKQGVLKLPHKTQVKIEEIRVPGVGTWLV